MDKGEISFKVEIAGVPARMTCRCPENHDFFLPYLTDKEEAFSVEITEEDIQYSIRLLSGDFGGVKVFPIEEGFLENITIRNVLSRKLLDYDVLMIHGSALCMDGEAYIFTAPSGTGKSTHARLWRETFGERVWMINDDRPMVRLEKGKAVAYGTPWDGKHRLSRNASAPLKAIVKLNRGAENSIEPLSKTDAFPVLLGQTGWVKRGPQKPRAIRLLGALLETIDCYTLRCNMDPDAALTAWKGMRNG